MILDRADDVHRFIDIGDGHTVTVDRIGAAIPATVFLILIETVPGIPFHSIRTEPSDGNRPGFFHRMRISNLQINRVARIDKEPVFTNSFGYQSGIDINIKDQLIKILVNITNDQFCLPSRDNIRDQI